MSTATSISRCASGGEPTSRVRSLSILACASLVALLAVSCRANPISKKGRLALDEVPAAIERARTLEVGTASDRDLAKTVGDLLRAGRAEIDSEQRLAVRQLLDRSAAELAKRSANPTDLEKLAEADMPSRIAVPAALRAARLLVDSDERSDAYGIIRKLDLRYPRHAQRDQAGELLYEIATSYRDDKRRRLFLFPYSGRAPGVFEYLSTEYPSHEKSDDALVELADAYAADRQYDLAIERHKYLVLWSRDSPHRAASEAAIPMLRLDDLDGPEYGRDQLDLALRELDGWVRTYGDHELRPEVDRARVDCLQRLADNDLVVAKFYRQVKSPEGARYHASRGLEFARRAGNGQQVTELRDFLASVDEIERVDAPRVLPDTLDQGLEAFDPSGTGTATGPGSLAPSQPLDLDSRRAPERSDPATPTPGTGTGSTETGPPNGDGQ